MKIKRIKFSSPVLFPGRSALGDLRNNRNEYNGQASACKSVSVTMEKGVFILTNGDDEVRVPHNQALWYVVDSSK